MKSKYGIPKQELESIINNHKNCEYCSKTMIFPFDSKNRGDSATIEHLNYDGPFYIKNGLILDDIVIVCQSCNSSRGRKKIIDWFKSEYCNKRNINFESVSQNVKDYIIRNPLK